MKRIDLTADSVFFKNNQVSPLAIIPEFKITNSQIQTNFLTGSINEINKRKFYLELERSIENIDPFCAKCGGRLFFLIDKKYGLCEECNKELEEDCYQSRVIELIKSKNRVTEVRLD